MHTSLLLAAALTSAQTDASLSDRGREWLRSLPPEWTRPLPDPGPRNGWRLARTSVLLGKTMPGSAEFSSLALAPAWGPPERAKARGLLRGAGPWIKLGLAAAASPSIVFPAEPLQVLRPALLTLRDAHAALLLRARAQMVEKKPWSEDARAAVALSTKLLRGSSTVGDYMAAGTFQIASYRLLALAEGSDRSLAAEVARTSSVPSPQMAMARALPVLAADMLDRTIWPPAAAAVWTKMGRSKAEKFRDHPRPYSRRATAEAFKGIMTRFLRPIRQGEDALDHLQRAADSLGLNMTDRMMGDYIRGPLTQESETGAIRLAMLETSNPMGKLALLKVVSRVALPTVSERTARVARDAVIFRGSRPGTPLPTDAFSKQPFRISRERRVMWSVGSNRVDDGGDARKDLVFHLP